MKSRSVVFIWNGFISVALVLSLWSVILMLRDGSSDKADAGDKPRVKTANLLEELEAAFDARRALPPQRIDKAPDVPVAYRPEPATVVAPPKVDKHSQPVSDKPPANASDLLAELEAAFDIPRTVPPQRIGKDPEVPPAYHPEPATAAAPPKADERSQPVPVAQNAGIDDQTSVKPLPSQGPERRQDVAANTRSLVQPARPSIKTAPLRPDQGAANETGGQAAVVPPRPERAPFRQARSAPVEEAQAKPGYAARASVLSFVAKLWQPKEPTSRRPPAPSADKDAVERREHRDTRTATSTANSDIVPTASVIPNSAKADAKRTPPPKWTPASCQPSLF
jgi:hypothetical protein